MSKRMPILSITTKFLLAVLFRVMASLMSIPKDGYRVITDTRIIGPGQINTETYLDIGVFKTEAEALHFDKFLKSKLPRVLLRQAISSLNVTRECFRFVPYVDFTEEWDDQRLYKMYGLTEEEIQLVEATIRPFESEAN